MDDHKLESLLELLADRTGCAYLSDLSYLTDKQHIRLVQVIESIPAATVKLSEWNDALDYLTHTEAAENVEAAKRRLLVQLSSAHPVSMGEENTGKQPCWPLK